jgi:hypothetical protein
MMTQIDLWSTLAAMAGIKPPPHGEWQDNDGKPIYFDSIDNIAYARVRNGGLRRPQTDRETGRDRTSRPVLRVRQTWGIMPKKMRIKI